RAAGGVGRTAAAPAAAGAVVLEPGARPVARSPVSATAAADGDRIRGVAVAATAPAVIAAILAGRAAAGGAAARRVVPRRLDDERRADIDRDVLRADPEHAGGRADRAGVLNDHVALVDVVAVERPVRVAVHDQP